MAAEWEAGRQYLPGDIVRPIGQGDVVQDSLLNPGFEDGDQDWTDSGAGSWTIDQVGPVFSGTWSGRAGYSSNPNGQSLTIVNDVRLAVVPGQPIRVRVKVISQNPAPSAIDGSRALLQIQWFNAGGAPLSPTPMAHDPTNVGGVVRINAGGIIDAACTAWTNIEVEGVAPDGAATCSASLSFVWGDGNFACDDFEIDYASQDTTSPYLFRAVQANAGFSGETEPDWPTVLGQQVVDNEVTWEAISNNFIEWQAQRILVSHPSTEPTWPEVQGGTVLDNDSIVWELDPRRVVDAKLPQSGIVLMAASKIFTADDDIIRFTATTNPLDLTTPDDAGFLPFGLREYGGNPVAAMGLYRGNIAAFNSQGCQIWEVDEDPASNHYLDGIPVPCTFHHSIAPVGDDLFLLTAEGIRSLAYAGATVNLQSGYTGKQVDPLVEELLEAALDAGWTPRGLYWAAQGQYWLFFGNVAVVVTINGEGKTAKRSWSEYTFPSAIDDWTILGTALFLRSGDLVWEVSKDALFDDQRYEAGVLVGEDIVGVMQWPYIDLDSPGVDKELIGFDVVASGDYTVAFGYDQAQELEFDQSNRWTQPYALSGDTVSGKPIPYGMTAPSLSPRVVFEAGQAWEWFSMNLYFKR